MAFSDQLEVFKSNFRKFADKTGIKSPDYLLGVESSLRKTFKNKYWFKGRIDNVVELSAARNEAEPFQLAIIPQTGFALNDIKISASGLRSVDAEGAVGRYPSGGFC